MKTSLGALTKLSEIWQASDNFYIAFQLDVEFDNNGKKGYELFSFAVASPKWLDALLQKSGIEMGRGYIFMNDFDIRILEKEIKYIISICTAETISETINSLSKFFKYEYDKI